MLKSTPISNEELHDFIQIDLYLIDNATYFHAIFDEDTPDYLEGD